MVPAAYEATDVRREFYEVLFPLNPESGAIVNSVIQPGGCRMLDLLLQQLNIASTDIASCSDSGGAGYHLDGQYNIGRHERRYSSP